MESFVLAVLFLGVFMGAGFAREWTTSALRRCETRLGKAAVLSVAVLGLPVAIGAGILAALLVSVVQGLLYFLVIGGIALGALFFLGGWG
jgi:hypothetical protein